MSGSEIGRSPLWAASLWHLPAEPDLHLEFEPQCTVSGTACGLSVSGGC